jgi:hypothetical protein
MKRTTRRLGLEALEQRDTPSAARLVPAIIFPMKLEMENVLVSSKAVSQPGTAVTVATPDHTHVAGPVAAPARIGPILDFPWAMKYELATTKGG